MRKQAMPHTDMQVTPIAYGCMPLGGSWGDEAISAETQDKANAALNQAIACDINYYDHADIYCGGKSETVFGNWLADMSGLRSRIYIQSKCGIVPGPQQQFNFSYQHIMERTRRSIEALQCEYLDTLVLHRPDVLMDVDEVAQAFNELHSQGLVRYFGVSNQPPACISRLQSALSMPLICNQIQLSLLHHHELSSLVDWNIPGRSLQHEGILEYCQQQQICIQPWAPLAKGFLDTRKPSEDHPQAEKIIEIQTALHEIAAAHQCSPAAVSLAWLLRLPGSIQPIIGTSTPQRIKDAAEAADVELSRDEWYRLFIAGRGQRLP